MKPRRIALDLPLITKQWKRLRPAGGFTAISIDVPSDFDAYSEKGEGKSASQHYPVMSDDDIARLPLELLAADNCACFAWFTWPKMPVWNRWIQAWGFEFAGLAWEWIKFNPETGKYAFGPGYGTRKNVEPCLLLTRGNPKLRPGRLEFFGNTVITGSRSVRDFIQEWPYNTIRAPRREHSRKPEEHRLRIETMFDGPRIDVFSRQRWPGNTVWGNEIDKFAEVAA